MAITRHQLQLPRDINKELDFDDETVKKVSTEFAHAVEKKNELGLFSRIFDSVRPKLIHEGSRLTNSTIAYKISKFVNNNNANKLQEAINFQDNHTHNFSLFDKKNLREWVIILLWPAPKDTKLKNKIKNIILKNEIDNISKFIIDLSTSSSKLILEKDGEIRPWVVNLFGEKNIEEAKRNMGNDQLRLYLINAMEHCFIQSGPTLNGVKQEASMLIVTEKNRINSKLMLDFTTIKNEIDNNRNDSSINKIKNSEISDIREKFIEPLLKNTASNSDGLRDVLEKLKGEYAYAIPTGPKKRRLTLEKDWESKAGNISRLFCSEEDKNHTITPELQRWARELFNDSKVDEIILFPNSIEINDMLADTRPTEMDEMDIPWLNYMLKIYEKNLAFRPDGNLETWIQSVIKTILNRLSVNNKSLEIKKIEESIHKFLKLFYNKHLSISFNHQEKIQPWLLKIIGIGNLDEIKDEKTRKNIKNQLLAATSSALQEAMTKHLNNEFPEKSKNNINNIIAFSFMIIGHELNAGLKPEPTITIQTTQARIDSLNQEENEQGMLGRLFSDTDMDKNLIKQAGIFIQQHDGYTLGKKFRENKISHENFVEKMSSDKPTSIFNSDPAQSWLSIYYKNSELYDAMRACTNDFFKQVRDLAFEQNGNIKEYLLKNEIGEQINKNISSYGEENTKIKIFIAMTERFASSLYTVLSAINPEHEEHEYLKEFLQFETPIINYHVKRYAKIETIINNLNEFLVKIKNTPNELKSEIIVLESKITASLKTFIKLQRELLIDPLLDLTDQIIDIEKMIDKGKLELQGIEQRRNLQLAAKNISEYIKHQIVTPLNKNRLDADRDLTEKAVSFITDYLENNDENLVAEIKKDLSPHFTAALSISDHDTRLIVEYLRTSLEENISNVTSNKRDKFNRDKLYRDELKKDKFIFVLGFLEFTGAHVDAIAALESFGKSSDIQRKEMLESLKQQLYDHLSDKLLKRQETLYKSALESILGSDHEQIFKEHPADLKKHLPETYKELKNQQKITKEDFTSTSPQLYKLAIYKNNINKPLETTIEITNRDNKPPISDITTIPDEIDMVQVFAKAIPDKYKSFFKDSPFLEKTVDYFRANHKAFDLSTLMEQIKINESIGYLRQFGGMASNLASTLFAAYQDATQQPQDHGGHYFPSDTIMRMAVYNVDLYREQTKNHNLDGSRPILIHDAWDPHYVEAVMLYCAMKKIPYENKTKWTGIVPVSDDMLKNFKEFYNGRYAELDKKRLDHPVEVSVSKNENSLFHSSENSLSPVDAVFGNPVKSPKP